MKQVQGKWVLETLAELVDPAHTALVAIDVQNDFCRREGLFGQAGRDLSIIERNLPNMVRMVREAQRLGVLTVHVRMNTAPHGLADSPASLRMKVRDGKSPEYTRPGTWGWAFVDGIVVADTDLVVDKYRPDAFHRTTLDLMLKANGIQTAVYIGVNTEGCVESTVRSNHHHDYYTVVIEDAVASSVPALHVSSLALMRHRWVVAGSADVIALWSAARAQAKRA